RARRDAGHKPNHERWMVSYADLLTLLLALFIVLYATSKQDKKKLQQLAGGMMVAFSGTPPALVSQPAAPQGPMHDLPKPVPVPRASPPVLAFPRGLRLRQPLQTLPPYVQPLSQKQQRDLEPAVKAIAALQTKLRALLQPQIDARTISIDSSPLSIKIRLNAKILFANGDATLTKGAVKILTPLATTLAAIPAGYRISIHGHTDDKRIHTVKFPSNWQLSTARALSVVMLFRTQGVPGEALSAAGFSKYHPIASNASAEGRQQNRRVSIVISAPSPAEATADQGATDHAKASPTTAPVPVDAPATVASDHHG
ncbi:MAG: OmpA family protein, partial [Paracoccaceae bacterium]|nr:OmpA family protein [Paracoccaceae bacterium]